MTSRFKPLALLVIPLLIAAVALGGSASGAGRSLTLKLKLEYAKKHRTACGKAKEWRFFHRGSTIEARGFLTPHPAGHFQVSIQVRRCVHGKWVDMPRWTVQGKKLTGKYKGFFHARPLAPKSHKKGAVYFYYARAFAGGQKSPKAYFAVTN